MHRHHRFIWVLGLLVGLAVATCQFPTDKSDEVYVTVVASDTLLARGVIGQGQTEFLFARAWRRLPSGDSAEIGNIDFSWFSDDNTIVRVERKPSGAAEITGVNVGTIAVRAKASAFEQSIDAAVPVRVAPNFIIDSIRPLDVSYGGKVSVFGVRIQQIFFIDQGFGTLIPDEFSFTGSLDGLGRLDYWVPYPTTTAHPFYFGPGVFGSVTDSVTVTQRDIYEINWEFPAPIDVSGQGGPRTFQGFPVVFYNPALYYEPFTDVATDGPFQLDWYRMTRADTTQAMTYILNSQVFDDTAYQYIADSLFFNGSFYTPAGWLNGPGVGTYYCYGEFFNTARETRSPTTVVALRTLPGPAVHLFSNFGKPGPYSVTVLRGYFTVDRRIGPDRFEENENWCRYADQNFSRSTDSTINGIHIVVGLFRPWRDSTLTIDNPNDLDWYRFRVQAPFVPADSMTTIRTRSLPFTALDFSDIDIYVHRASDFAQLGASFSVGSNEVVSLNLPAGDYYLGVVDAAATPTRYSMCMVHGGAGVNCTPGTLPSVPAPSQIQLAPSVHRIPMLPPVEQRLQRLQRLFGPTPR